MVLPAFWLGLPPQLIFSGNTHRDGPRGVSMVNSNPVMEGDVNIEGSLESDPVLVTASQPRGGVPTWASVTGVAVLRQRKTERG